MANDRPQSHHSTFHGWKVEARITAGQPRQIGEQIFDAEWRDVSFARSKWPIGVPPPDLNANALSECGLLGYEQAQAVRWWFHAGAPYFSGLETRLVAFKVRSDIEWCRVGEQEVIDERQGLKQPQIQQGK